MCQGSSRGSARHSNSPVVRSGCIYMHTAPAVPFNTLLGTVTCISISRALHLALIKVWAGLSPCGDSMPFRPSKDVVLRSHAIVPHELLGALTCIECE